MPYPYKVCTSGKRKKGAVKAPLCNGRSHSIRLAARVVCINKQGQIGIIHYRGRGKKKPYFSLPGGGVIRGESIRAGAMREAVEETGYKVDKVVRVGAAISEQINGAKQSTYGFVMRRGRYIGDCRTEREIKDNMITMWMEPLSAIRKILITGRNQNAPRDIKILLCAIEKGYIQ